MNSSIKKKKSSSPHCISKLENIKGSNKGEDEDLKKSGTNKKIIWTSAALLERMKPDSLELRYREKKLEFSHPIEKYSRYFKCTKCQLNFKNLTENTEKIAVHPFLKVLFCQECLGFYEDGEFSVDSDGEEKYCRWCGEGGLMYSCSDCVCGFCTACIKKHFGVKYNAQVNKNNDWKCFICFPKPLWFLRFVCFVVEKETKHKNLPFTTSAKTVPSQGAEPGTASGSGGKNSKPKDDENLKNKDYNSLEVSSSSSENTARKFDEGSSTSCSISMSDTKESLSDVDTPALKRGIKRKLSSLSSSDESDDVGCRKIKKQAKDHENLGSNSRNNLSNQNFVNSELLDRLEKILRLAEYQMGFGVSWSSKMLTKLFKPNSMSTLEELKNECQKIKWFFSILSTYLVESCSSVDLIVKSIENNEDKIDVNSPDKSQQGDYSTVVRFLDFVTNQVKVFLEKGIRLQDLLEGEIYYDNDIIGVKVKSNAAASTSSASQTNTPNSKIKNLERKLSDSKFNNEEKTSDDESIVPTLEAEADNDSSETEISKRLNLSDPITDYLEDAEEQKSKILEIMSILENA